MSNTISFPALLNERQAAARLSVSHRSLQKWRVSGQGPAFVKLPGTAAVRYRAEDIDAFIVAGLRKSTSDTGREAA